MLDCTMSHPGIHCIDLMQFLVDPRVLKYKQLLVNRRLWSGPAFRLYGLSLQKIPYISCVDPRGTKCETPLRKSLAASVILESDLSFNPCFNVK